MISSSILFMKFKDETEYDDLNNRRRIARLKIIGFSGIILLFFLIFDVFPRSFSRSIQNYTLYDEKTNTIYVVDARTYNDWIRMKGVPPTFKPNSDTKVVKMSD